MSAPGKISLRGVAVITCASLAQGPRFYPGGDTFRFW